MEPDSWHIIRVEKLSGKIYQSGKEGEVFWAASISDGGGVCEKILGEPVRDTMETQGPYQFVGNARGVGDIS